MGLLLNQLSQSIHGSTHVITHPPTLTLLARGPLILTLCALIHAANALHVALCEALLIVANRQATWARLSLSVQNKCVQIEYSSTSHRAVQATESLC